VTGRFCRLPCLTLALAIALSVSQTNAQTVEHPPEHPPLQKSAAIEFADAFEQALQKAPEDLLTQSAREQASSAQSIAERWIVGAPAWQASVIDDRLLSDRGLRELETGVAVNIWRPGERDDARALGTAYQQRSAAMQNYLRWLVAGRVRGNLAALELADLQVAATLQAQQDALQLLETTGRLQSAGALSALDVLQAESLWLQKGAEVLDANAALVDAERSWQVLTGLSTRPERAHHETRSALEEITAEHPLLALRLSEVTLSQRNVDEAERNAKGSPNISFGVRRERGDWQQPYIDSVGVSVSIPITSPAVVASGSSDARAASVNSELAHIQDLRALTAQLHEVEHELFTLEQALPLTERQVQVNQQQWQMAQTAFAVGETDLTHVMMAMQRAQDSARVYQQQLLRQQHLNSEYNQIIGVLP
jgi:cobalt-zinc-cadmium efflux system outer membrane protein